jgi:hypothetical protein
MLSVGSGPVLGVASLRQADRQILGRLSVLISPQSRRWLTTWGFRHRHVARGGFGRQLSERRQPFKRTVLWAVSARGRISLRK